MLTLHPTTTGSREGILEGSLTTETILLLKIPGASPRLQGNWAGVCGPSPEVRLAERRRLAGEGTRPLC